MIDIVTDSEFKALIPPLSDAELEGLESDIVEAGRALVPLMLWNKILVDGHKRYAICTKHDLPYEVMEVGHPEWTRTDARIWIRRNQLHRRNIDGLTRCEIALGLEEDLKKQADENLRLSPGRPKKEPEKGLQNSANLFSEPGCDPEKGLQNSANLFHEPI